MDKDNLWSRRSKYVITSTALQNPASESNKHSSSKLSLSTPSATQSNGSSTNGDHTSRPYTLSKRYGDSTSSHGGKANPFNTISTPAAAMPSPTSGTNPFALGTGAFASFGGSVKDKKVPGGALDFTNVAGGAKTPTAEKNATLTRSLAAKASSNNLGAVSSMGVTKSKNTTYTPTAGPAHILRNGWVFWYRPPISKSNGYLEYEKTLHAMAGFDTAEDFFLVYKHLKRPSTLPLVSDYHIFKKGIRPVWEDDENKKGGKWIVRLKKNVADRYWEDLLFAIVGDQFGDASDEVCGAVLSVRNGEDILSIWTRNEGQRVLKIR
jgi:translation initiation factor 4E